MFSEGFDGVSGSFRPLQYSMMKVSGCLRDVLRGYQGIRELHEASVEFKGYKASRDIIATERASFIGGPGGFRGLQRLLGELLKASEGFNAFQ